MKLVLSVLPDSLRFYNGKALKDWRRMLAPDAAASILRIETETGGLVYTELFRTPELSLLARSQKTGVQRPAFSAHNYGLAIDVDLDSTMRLRRWTYAELRAVLEGYGWYCHRRDLKSGASEAWHFNFLGARGPEYMKGLTGSAGWALPAEQLMQERYGSQMKLTATQVQTALQSLKLYSGTLDGRLGPVSKTAIQAFQRTWGLEPTGLSDAPLQRTLAYVTAQKTLVSPAASYPAVA